MRLYDRELTAGEINALIPVAITARETEDSNGDGQIDRIRITTSKDHNADFSGLNIAVSGYTVTGYAAGGPANVFFVNVNQSGTPDSGVTPTVEVVYNHSLGDADGHLIKADLPARPEFTIVTFTGTSAAINTALDGMNFDPTPDFITCDVPLCAP